MLTFTHRVTISMLRVLRLKELIFTYTIDFSISLFKNIIDYRV